MLSRLLPKPSHFRALTLVPSKLQSQPQPRPLSAPRAPPSSNSAARFRFFSSNGGGGDGKDGKSGDDRPEKGVWNLSQENAGDLESFFGGDGDAEAGTWMSGGGDEWEGEEAHKPWTLTEEDEKKDDLFDIRDLASEPAEVKDDEIEKAEVAQRLEREEQALTAMLKGPNRAFGDLITASGITDEMIDSLIALKDLEGVEGLPPLKELEELRNEKGKKKLSLAEQERIKQEEAAKARVRQVDDKGRAYGTGRRKCSVARVWIQPGNGKFVINDKDLDVYFPILDYRAALLRPFSETKTLGLWDVNCTVKGGGMTGQAGAILLGVSRALQNWEPDLRHPLKAVGFLTRDPRMVERKKPGQAKARKSYQWVKR